MSTRSDIRTRPALPSSAVGPAPATPGADACDVFHIDPSRVARLRQALIASSSVEALAETFKALGDPTRVRVLDALSHGELCVCDLAQLVGLSQSATSHQLRLLRALRLVRSRRAGRMVFYTLDDRHIVTLFRQGLRHVEEAAAKPRRRLA
jgi:ArsR family transcriptional regulator, lead/cadmium/zinc/bismuth-responsive transcriptional repressor